MPSWCHSSMVSSGTLSSAATSSVVKRSDSAPASSPDSGTSTGAIAVGGQFGSGHDHNTGMGRWYWSVDRRFARSVSEGPGCPVAYLGHEGFRPIHNRFKQLAGHHALRIGGLGQIQDNFLQ